MLIITGVAGSALGLPAQPDEVLPVDMAAPAEAEIQLRFEGEADAVAYRQHRELGEGTFGAVLAFRQTDRADLPRDFAVKRYKPDADRLDKRDEINMVWLRNAKGKPGADELKATMVPAVYLDDAIVMRRGLVLDHALGDPSIVPDARVFDVCANIAIGIYTMELQLIKGGLIYTDMKMANIALFNEGDDGEHLDETSLMFLDYGGLCSVSEGGPARMTLCASTYPSPPDFQEVFRPRTVARARTDAMYWAALMYVMMPLARAAEWHGDDLAADNLRQIYRTLSFHDPDRHPWPAPSADDRALTLRRLQGLIKSTLPDRRADVLASWLSWDPADRMRADEALEIFGLQLEL